MSTCILNFIKCTCFVNIYHTMHSLELCENTEFLSKCYCNIIPAVNKLSLTLVFEALIKLCWYTIEKSCKTDVSET